MLYNQHKSTIKEQRYHYDSEQHLLSTQTFKSLDESKTEEAQYNAFGEVTSKGLNGRYTTHVDYDTMGRVWRSNTDGHYQLYLYDARGLVTQVVSLSNGILKNPEAAKALSDSLYDTALDFSQGSWLYDLQRQNNTYDAQGNLISQSKEFSVNARGTNEAHLSTHLETHRFDRWGNLLTSTNHSGYTTTYEYNASNQLIKQELPEVWVMDEHGVKKAIKPTNTYYYDELGRAVGMMDAGAHTVSKEYDANGATREKHYNLLDQMSSSTKI